MFQYLGFIIVVVGLVFTFVFYAGVNENKIRKQYAAGQTDTINQGRLLITTYIKIITKRIDRILDWISYYYEELTAPTRSRHGKTIKIFENITIAARHPHVTDIFTVIGNLL